MDVLCIDKLNCKNILDFQKTSGLQWNSLGSEQRVAAKITDFCRYIASTPLAAVCVPIQRRRSWKSLIIFLRIQNFHFCIHPSLPLIPNWCISVRLSIATEPVVSILVAMLSKLGFPLFQRQCKRSCGPMDKASDYESGDWRFESCQDQTFFCKGIWRFETPLLRLW